MAIETRRHRDIETERQRDIETERHRDIEASVDTRNPHEYRQYNNGWQNFGANNFHIIILKMSLICRVKL